MSSPFNNQADSPRPGWTNNTAPNGNFTALSSTGQIEVAGGYGLGGYGNGPYGTGETTQIAVSTVLTTQWTYVQTK